MRFTRFMADLLARAGGANLDALEDSPHDRGTFISLGSLMMATATIGDLACTVAIHMATGASILACIPLGMIFGVVVYSADRLMVMGAAKRHALLATLLRLGATLAASLLFAEILLLALFARDISAQVTADQQDARYAAITQAQHQYGTPLTAVKGQIQNLESQIATAKANMFNAAQGPICEAALPSCSKTGLAGQGPQYQLDELQLQQATQIYNTTVAQDTPKIASLQSEANLLQNQLQSAMTQAADANPDGGLLGRYVALNHYLAAHAGSGFWVWLTRGLLIGVDAAPVLIVVLLGELSYDSVIRTRRRQTELLQSERLNETNGQNEVTRIKRDIRLADLGHEAQLRELERKTELNRKEAEAKIEHDLAIDTARTVAEAERVLRKANVERNLKQALSTPVFTVAPSRWVRKVSSTPTALVDQANVEQAN